MEHALSIPLYAGLKWARLKGYLSGFVCLFVLILHYNATQLTWKQRGLTSADKALIQKVYIISI